MAIEQLADSPSSSVEPSLRSRQFQQRFYADAGVAMWNDWQWQMRNRIRDLQTIERILRLSTEERRAIEGHSGSLPLSVTPYYASLLSDTDPQHPLRRTIVMTEHEFRRTPDEADDPLAEDDDRPVPGLIHRYPDRVLLLATNVCPVYCRYCTRSRLVGATDATDHFGTGQWEEALGYIAAHSCIRDVLISGGEPLLLANSRLEWLLRRLRQIPHVEFVRIGTKVPAVLPQRITPGLVATLNQYGPLWMSLHFTHPDELTPETALACSRLADAGIPLGSQTVLLRGINDDVQTMRRLFHGLLRLRVRPYYLYQCDKVAGTGHFRTPIQTGLDIIQGLRGHTSGYAVPTFVIDLPDGGGKVPIGPDYRIGREGAALVFRNYAGQVVRYADSAAGAAGPAETLGNGVSASGCAAPWVREGAVAGLRIGITFDLKDDYLRQGLSRESAAEFDSAEVIDAIESALRGLGHTPKRIGGLRALAGCLAAGERWDLVFNIAEGFLGLARESQVPGLLDAYQIPYVFSEALTLAITLHKGVAKQLVRAAGVRTPDFQIVEDAGDIDRVRLSYPLFVKPVAEGSSKGISAASKVGSVEDLDRTCRQLLRTYQQPVLVEAFLPGREFTVGMLGTGTHAEVIAVMEVMLGPVAEAGGYSYLNKAEYQRRVTYRLADDATARAAARAALLAWRHLGCRDAGRVDLRCDGEGNPHFLEVNPLPGLHPERSDLVILCGLAGISYQQLIRQIVASAVTRIVG